MPDVPDGMGQVAGIYTIPEWSAVQGQTWARHLVGPNLASGDYKTDAYKPPADKTLFINLIAVSISAPNEADRDKPQHFHVSLYTDPPDEWDFDFGGDGGDIAPLRTPLVVPGGKYVNLYVQNMSGHIATAMMDVLGYEI